MFSLTHTHRQNTDIMDYSMAPLLLGEILTRAGDWQDACRDDLFVNTTLGSTLFWRENNQGDLRGCGGSES